MRDSLRQGRNLHGFSDSFLLFQLPLICPLFSDLLLEAVQTLDWIRFRKIPAESINSRPRYKKAAEEVLSVRRAVKAQKPRYLFSFRKQLVKLVNKRVNILELPVYRCETDIGDLVYVLKPLHHHIAYLR